VGVETDTTVHGGNWPFEGEGLLEAAKMDWMDALGSELGAFAGGGEVGAGVEADACKR
jgi:hypothetical protein